MKNKWELKLYDRVEYPYYELTNGSISLIADCGFVGETEEEESALFKKVTDTLNESGIDFRSNSKLELEQHIEIMQLQDKYDELKAENERLKVERNKWFGIAGSSESALNTIKIDHADLKAKARKLVDTLAIIKEQADNGIFPHLPVETVGAAMCINISKLAGDALSEYNQSMGGEKV